MLEESPGGISSHCLWLTLREIPFHLALTKLEARLSPSRLKVRQDSDDAFVAFSFAKGSACSRTMASKEQPLFSAIIEGGAGRVRRLSCSLCRSRLFCDRGFYFPTGILCSNIHIPSMIVFQKLIDFAEMDVIAATLLLACHIFRSRLDGGKYKLLLDWCAKAEGNEAILMQRPLSFFLINSFHQLTHLPSKGSHSGRVPA